MWLSGGKRARLKGLQDRERCDAVVWQAAAHGEPAASCLSVQVVPASWVACERVAVVDGEAELAPVLAWPERYGQVVESRPHVEQVVAHEDGQLLREADFFKVEDVFPARTLALGLHRLDHRVFAAFSKGFGERVDIREVFVGPLELQTMRWGRWERRFDLAPLRRSELAPPPSDWLLTV